MALRHPTKYADLLSNRSAIAGFDAAPLVTKAIALETPAPSPQSSLPDFRSRFHSCLDYCATHDRERTNPRLRILWLDSLDALQKTGPAGGTPFSLNGTAALGFIFCSPWAAGHASAAFGRGGASKCRNYFRFREAILRARRKILDFFIPTWALDAMSLFCCPGPRSALGRFGRRPVILLQVFGLSLDYLILAGAPNIRWLFL